jgi:mRNA interferase MazF
MPFSRGDVVLVLFPNSDLRTARRRPVLVVQADQLGTGLPQVVVAMISSNLARSGHPSRVTVKSTDSYFHDTGLLSDSIIMTDNLATVLEIEIHRKIGRFAGMNEVGVAMRHTLGL